MTARARRIAEPDYTKRTALEEDFPIVEISQVAEQESWRKEVNRPLYHIHKWWAQRLGSVFRAITLAALRQSGSTTWADFYVEHDLKDKIVLDPFMGSGTTLGEALKLGATAIGCDVNPVSTFLVQQALTPVDEALLRNEFARLEEDVSSDIRRYYQTRDPETNSLIPVMYFFWVKTVETPSREIIPLFDRYVFAQDAYPKKKPKAQIICPNCWTVTEDRYDCIELTCKGCSTTFNPQEGPAKGPQVRAKDGTSYRIKALLPDGRPPEHRMYAMLALRANGEKVYLSVRPEDVALYNQAELELRTATLPLPTTHVRSGHNTDQARGYNYLEWRQFFNARQLLCLGMLLKAINAIEDQVVREQLICLFSSTLEFNNMFCSYKGEGTGAVRHMFSNHILKPERTPLENSVWGSGKGSGTFLSLFESRLIKAKQYLDRPFEVKISENPLGGRGPSSKVLASKPIRAGIAGCWDDLVAMGGGALVLNGNSARLPLPSNSVDAVITDPPYFDFVHYSELSDFFFAWLSPALKDRYAWFDKADSSDQGEVQQKDPRVFAEQLALVLSECARVLKNDGVLAFSFHHSRSEGWAAIYEALELSGLHVVAAHPVHAEQRGTSPKTAAKDPITLDAILVCRKRGFGSVEDLARLDVRTEALARRLRDAGMPISAGDRFVISASQLLIDLGDLGLSFDEARSKFAHLRS